MQEAHRELEEKFLQMSQEIVKLTGLNVYDVQYVPGQTLLRVFIINPETNSADIEDCVKVDRAFTDPIQEADWVPEELHLEVSSPGIYRHLRLREHFEMATGELISLTWMGESLVGDSELAKNRKIRGVVKSVDEKGVEIESSGKVVFVPFNQIKKAHLDPDFETLQESKV